MERGKFPKITILGAGLSGLSVAYHYKGKSEIYEKDSKIGGTASTERYGNFLFDHGPHLSFTKDQYVISLLNSGTSVVEKYVRPINHYQGLEFPHPALFHLRKLKKDLGYKILTDLIEQYKNDERQEPYNYDEWCIKSQGKYFAENFTKLYTKKFWRTDPKELSTDWVRDRIPTPSIKEAVSGTFGLEKNSGYYFDKYRYPRSGGFGSFSNFWNLRKNDVDIKLRMSVKYVDPSAKYVKFSNGEYVHYSTLVSTLPLPVLIPMIKGVPSRIVQLSRELKHSSLHYINIALKNRLRRKYSWVYFYDSDIPVSRLIAYDNVGNNMSPRNSSAVQIEIPYTKIYDSKMSDEALGSMVNLGYIDEKSIENAWEFSLQFGYPIHDLRRISILKEIFAYLDEIEIFTVGRYGRWEHLWSHQVITQGKEMANSLNSRY